MSYSVKKSKVKPLSEKQSKYLFEHLRNETDMDGRELLDLYRDLKKKKFIRRGAY